MNQSRSLSAVVLAAGAGTRMKSSRPKPLHMLCGRPMVQHVLDSLKQIRCDWVVLVVGHGADRVVKTLDHAVSLPIHYVEQKQQLGTGHAVSIALSSLPAQMSDETEESDILILPGDTPLLDSATVSELVSKHRASGAAATILTVDAIDPTGYGRIVRDKHKKVLKVVEQRDASSEELSITEVNTSVYCFRTSLLGVALRKVDDGNDQNEIYLTDAIEILASAGHSIETLIAPDIAWAVGVNDRAQLAAAETELRRRINESWMIRGVTMVDPSTTYLDINVELSQDVTLYNNVRLEGNTSVETGSEIGPNTTLRNCVVGSDCVISNTVANDVDFGNACAVGPFVVLESVKVEPKSKVVPFVNLDGETQS